VLHRLVSPRHGRFRLLERPAVDDRRPDAHAAAGRLVLLQFTALQHPAGPGHARPRLESCHARYIAASSSAAGPDCARPGAADERARLYRAIWPVVQRAFKIREHQIEADMTGWHTYRLDWAVEHTTFRVDGAPILEDAPSPGGRSAS